MLRPPYSADCQKIAGRDPALEALRLRDVLTRSDDKSTTKTTTKTTIFTAAHQRVLQLVSKIKTKKGREDMHGLKRIMDFHLQIHRLNFLDRKQESRKVHNL